MPENVLSIERLDICLSLTAIYKERRYEASDDTDRQYDEYRE
ncbi:hypothetical protein [Iodobacter fluviatilis]|nr:hypothetical protein [Iodobacter fluviatilis]